MAWIKTNKEEPECLDDYDYIWTYSRYLGVEIFTVGDYIDWGLYSHWQPANIKEPESPKLEA